MNQYTIFSLGDSAVTIDLGNRISPLLNQKVIAMQEWLQHNRFGGLIDIVISYSSLTVLYDAARVRLSARPVHTVYEYITRQLENAYASADISTASKRLIHIPVCYDPSLGPDLDLVAGEMQLGTEEVVALHSGREYRVYLIGFLPGFPYMAEVDERIAIHRKDKPRRAVPAGSVGIAGMQTGIYPMESPGGWQIIGRTPVKLFDKSNIHFLRIRAGDTVQFYPVDMPTYEKLLKFKSPIAYY